MSSIRKIIKDLENYETDNQNKIFNLERQVDLLSTELKMYKELQKETRIETIKDINTLHLLIHKETYYSGMDNETCLGVFTKHSTLLFHLTKILKQNTSQKQKYALQSFKDIEISLKTSLKKDDNINMLFEEIEYDDEYHTSILGIEVNTVRYYIGIDSHVEAEYQVEICKEPVKLDKFIDDL